MSSSNTDSENSFESEDSDVCSLSEYDIAFEDGDLKDMRATPSKSEESVDMAYEKEQEENAKLERMLEDRLNTTKRNYLNQVGIILKFVSDRQGKLALKQGSTTSLKIRYTLTKIKVVHL